MRINVRNIIDMWDNKSYSSAERQKEFKAILKYYNSIINYIDFGILTINIHSMIKIEYKDILTDMKDVLA